MVCPNWVQTTVQCIIFTHTSSDEPYILILTCQLLLMVLRLLNSICVGLVLPTSNGARTKSFSAKYNTQMTLLLISLIFI